MPWKAAADINLGRFYSGFSGYFRQDLSVRPFAFYELELVTHRFDYFGGNQTNFFSNRVPTSNVQESELFAKASIATPINLYENLLAKLSLTVGKNIYEYYQTDRFTSYDIADRTDLSYIRLRSILRRTPQITVFTLPKEAHTRCRCDSLTWKRITARAAHLLRLVLFPKKYITL